MHRSLRFGVPLAIALLAAACATPSAPPATLSGNEQCLRDLDGLGVGYRIAAAPAAHGACVVANPVEVASTGLVWNRPGVLSCPMAEAVDRFTLAVVEPLARQYFGVPVVRLNQIGAYSCRTIAGHAGHWSEHAVGRAIDIAGFDLAGGDSVSVERDWYAAGRKRDFLHRIALAACSYFNLVLTPESNRDHFNHLHFDLGPYKLCEADGRKVWSRSPPLRPGA